MIITTEIAVEGVKCGSCLVLIKKKQNTQLGKSDYEIGLYDIGDYFSFVIIMTLCLFNKTPIFKKMNTEMLMILHLA